ncbi:hypothetical protein [Propionivibrio sp.]|uniref:hypothetical protein n=1 Tax=Propionivibrio sp. TaxID=2212460 RepID=UPI003BEF982D
MNAHNRCRSCGATSYKPIISRDEKGGMRPSGQYRCVGCNLVFKAIDEWRVGGDPLLARHTNSYQESSLRE